MKQRKRRLSKREERIRIQGKEYVDKWGAYYKSKLDFEKKLNNFFVKCVRRKHDNEVKELQVQDGGQDERD